MFTVNILTVAAYTAIVVSLIYLVVYTKMFDWYRSTLGRVMNLSIVSVAIIAVGTVSRTIFMDDQLGRIISFVGWLFFSVLLLWRLIILVYSYNRIHQRRLQDVDKDYQDRVDQAHQAPSFCALHAFAISSSFARSTGP